MWLEGEGRGDLLCGRERWVFQEGVEAQGILSGVSWKKKGVETAYAFCSQTLILKRKCFNQKFRMIQVQICLVQII